SACHGAPLGDDEIRLVKQGFGFDPDKSFQVPPEVYGAFEKRARALHRLSLKWRRQFKAWGEANPELAAAWRRHFSGELPDNLESLLPAFDAAKPVATRAASGAVLNALAPALPQLVGGSADLAPSNNTCLKGLGDVGPRAFGGRNLHFGIRELGMTAILNGMAVHGGFKVFGGTFFVFSDYCRPALRLAAMMKLPVVFVFTHDSFYVGEDGPTHEPVEQMAALRAMPGVTVLRPAEATETGAAWLWALRSASGPVALLLSRQNLEILDRTLYPAASMVERGAYTLWQSGGGKPDAIVVATGSEVGISLEAARKVAAEDGRNIRVVSMPSRELFEAQPANYREEVLPAGCARRLVVEAGVKFGWEGVAGPGGRILSVEGFGLSGPYKALAQHFGFTAAHVAELLRAL
ncbi:MAG: transketolase, partial [Kiritimatiellae bacterium]|nr:transketolase [Kiritimatiellia bacterium]